MTIPVPFPARVIPAPAVSTTPRKREVLPRDEVKEAISSLETEIENLEDELREKKSEQSDLRQSLREAPRSASEIAVGRGCLVCREYEPQTYKIFCLLCEEKINELLLMGKTPQQICGSRSDLLASVERMIPQNDAEAAP